MSSNLVHALDAALDRFDSTHVFEEIEETSSWLRQRLRDLGFRIVAADSDAAPAVITLALPPNMSSTDLGDSLERAGFSLSYNSEYLRARNWIQVCLMGDFARRDVDPLLDAMAHVQLA